MNGPPPRSSAWHRRADFRTAAGVLLVLRAPPPAPPSAPGQPPAVPGDPAEGPELLLALADDGHALGLHGHVDLGTGLATALAQIVAEELDLPIERVAMRLGDTASTPNQGPTIASGSIQVHGGPLQRAAAQARGWLVDRAAARWGVDPAALATERGEVHAPDGRRIAYGALVAGGHVELMLDPRTPVKPTGAHRVVGQPVPRVDLAAKVTGEAIYVHDLRLPGMLHGRVVRPPYAGVDAGDFVGRSLRAVHESSIAQLQGIVSLVVIGDFIGIVAEREEQAEAAMHALRCDWAPNTPMPALDDLAQAISANPGTARVVAQTGDVDAALAGAALRVDRDYVWPYQLHASIGPSCAVAHWPADADGRPGPAATVWTGSQNPHVLRADLARLVGLAPAAIDVVRLEASGCYGRNGADDVAADALLLARAAGRPVRVQLSREQEHLWEPKGAAQLMRVRGGLDAGGAPLAYDFSTSYPSNGAPTLALLLTGVLPATAQAFEMGDRTAVPPYAYAHQRITVNDMAPILRASWLRGVSALPNSFAHESHVDELAAAAGADPLAYRLAHLPDVRAAELLRATALRAGWLAHDRPQQQPAQGDWLRGQGLAYARYVHSRFPGQGAAWAAWVADVAVHRVTGEVQVRRVVVGQDAGLMVNPLGVTHQVHGNVLQTTSRALKERLAIDPASGFPEAAEWGSYPILNFRELPVVDVLLVPRPGEPPLGVGESASVPGTAAIANAIFDATGLRLRQPPFTAEVVRAAMHPLPAPPVPPSSPEVARPMPQAADPQRGRRPAWLAAGALLGALVGGLVALGAAALGRAPAIAPVSANSAGVYSAALVERGRALAALGNCVACHTADGGQPNAGGRPLATPFGTVYSTNLSPDPDTGIGRWSFSAFQRAMREGLARDGRHLYPAFPYPAFTQAGDDELTALYAWLMVQPPVASAVPETRLRWPFDQRPLLALWNALFLQPGPVAAATVAAAPPRSAEWSRGAALVNGLGHCGGCHTPRGALGEERKGSAYLGGAVVDGWEAPALGALSRSPLPWTETAMLRYLRQGHDPAHGIAGGPMAPVVRALAQADEADVRAIAHYLVSLQPEPPGDAAALAGRAAALVARAAAQPGLLPGAAQRMFESACGACHHDGDGPQLLGLNLPLALNANLHSARPDNLIRTVFDGITSPAFVDIGHMPAFRHALSDRQIAELAGWMRRRFAPGEPPWADLPAAAARLRATPP